MANAFRRFAYVVLFDGNLSSRSSTGFLRYIFICYDSATSVNRDDEANVTNEVALVNGYEARYAYRSVVSHFRYRQLISVVRVPANVL